MAAACATAAVIVTVDVQHPRASNLIRRDLARLEGEAIGTTPKHRALAGGTVDDDIGRLIGTALAALHVVEVDPGGLQSFPIGCGRGRRRRVCRYTWRAVPGGRRPPGRWPPVRRADHFPFERRFAGVRRKAGNDEQGVGGIQPHTHNVEIRHLKYCGMENDCSPPGRRDGLLPDSVTLWRRKLRIDRPS